MKSLFKQSLREILKNKSYVIVLSLLVILTSFMYFFVQFSIDKNMQSLISITKSGVELSINQQQFLTALKSNTILARSFLISLIAITSFVFYMFYKRFFSLHQRQIGCFQALGFSDMQISLLYVLFTLIISTIGSLLGMIFGYFGSDILIKANIDSYSVTNVQKGIHFSSFLIGIVFVVAILCMFTLFACNQFYGKETALLINASLTKRENGIVVRIANTCASVMPEKNRFSVRIAMRKPVTILLTIIAVTSTTCLFLVSYSLNLSSKKVYLSQTAGHNYLYNTTYDTYQTDNNAGNSEIVYYLQTPFSILLKNGEEIQYQLIGMDKAEPMLQLENKQNQVLSIPSENFVIVNPALQELYGFHKGDVLTFIINGKEYTASIYDIAENAQSNSVYMSRAQLSQWLELPSNVHSGALSKEILHGNNGKVESLAQRLEELDKAAVSNRVSGVINQVIGCVVGCLLIYLVLLLNFQDSTKDILILQLLGYQTKQINNMLINIYRPILCLGFVIMLMPSIWISKSIQISLSIQTGDYMPYQTGIPIIIFIFAVINITYTVVQWFFVLKIRKIVREELITDSLL